MIARLPLEIIDTCQLDYDSKVTIGDYCHMPTRLGYDRKVAFESYCHMSNRHHLSVTTADRYATYKVTIEILCSHSRHTKFISQLESCQA